MVLGELWERKVFISFFLLVIGVLTLERDYKGPKTVFNLHMKYQNYPYINWTLLDKSNLASIFGIFDKKQVHYVELLPRDFKK